MYNQLVNQKNSILSLLNDEKYEEAITLLNFAAPLWVACDYEYKLNEIRNRIINELQSLASTATHWKVAAKWQRILKNI